LDRESQQQNFLREAHNIDRSGWHPPMFPQRFREGVIANGSSGATPLPPFRPDSPEDSLFLPRCEHAPGSHFALGLANGEIAK
jgi:hypothetical protein